MTIRKRIRVRVNDYIGVFYYADKRGRWRKFDQIGNAGVALDVAGMLQRVGHKVKVIYEEVEDE